MIAAVTTLDFKHELIDQLDWYWNQMLMPRLEGLTDEEYLWEPAAGCWSIRRSDDGSWEPQQGNPIPPEPEPVTTIAWRMAHIAEMLMRRSANQFGAAGLSPDLAGTAESAIARMRQGYADWKGGLKALASDEIARPTGPTEGTYAESPLASLVLHMNREIIHHGAEIALLRDLYRATQLARPLVQALLSGDESHLKRLIAEDPDAIDRLKAEHPDLLSQAAQSGSGAAVRILARHGFDPAAEASTAARQAWPRVARPALHAAAALGNVAMCRLLVDLGADLTHRDKTWNETPLGWAKFCNQAAAADYLESITPPD